MKCLNCGSENIVKKGMLNDKQKFKCKDCNASFTEGVKYVPKIIYTEKCTAICPHCGSTNNIRDGKLESGHQRYKCKKCGARHSAENSFKPYVNTEYICPNCGSKNLKKKGLNKTKKYEVYQCKDCLKQFMPLNKPRVLTNQEKIDILRLYKLGVSISNISESINRNPRPIARFLKSELNLDKLRNIGNKQYYNRLRVIKRSKLEDQKDLIKFRCPD